MRTIQKIQKEIDRAAKAGLVFEKESLGRDVTNGYHCEVCNKNFAGVNIYVYPDGKKSTADPMSQHFALVGSECFKNLRFHRIKKLGKV